VNLETQNFYKNFFNLNCYKNRTCELVANSTLVITHPASTSISFPIIFKKPMIFITTNELEKHYYKYVTYRMTTNSINQPFINISNQKNFLKNLNDIEIDFNGYSKYFENFIKNKHSINKGIWDVFVEKV